MRELIDKAADIVEEYHSKREQVGLDYNVFTLMDIERRERETHEYMIYSILNYKNSLCKKEFIKQFLCNMGIPQSFLRGQWDIEKEHYAGNYGIIDLFLHSNGQKKCVVVELKVDAGDQKNQIKRYEEYVLKCGYQDQDYRIIYLTLDGKQPSEQSCGEMKNTRRLLCKSYGEHLVNWLESCMEICQANSVDAGFIQQYWILLKKLTREESMDNDMENEIAGLIKNSQDLKACLGIEQALPLIKGQILYDFMDAIYHAMEKKDCEFLYVKYECAKKFYNRNSDWPGIVCKITRFTSRNKSIILGLWIGVENSTLQFSIGYYDEENQVIINNNDFMKSNSRINQRMENAIMEVLNTTIRNNSYNCIIWNNILDSYNQRYDFKHFSENCADLKDKKILKKEADCIAKELMYYIKEIKAILEEE